MSAKSPVLVFRAPTTGPVRQDAIDKGAPADFQDKESQRVLGSVAVAIARELGRQAARDLFAKSIDAKREP